MTDQEKYDSAVNKIAQMLQHEQLVDIWQGILDDVKDAMVEYEAEQEAEARIDAKYNQPTNSWL